MIRRFLLTLFVTTLLGFGIYAQDTGGVRGKVRNPKGKAVANVQVTVRKDGKDIKSGKTDKNGEFQFDGLEPDVYSLVFEADGYANGVRTGVVVEKKKTRDLGDKLVLSVDAGTLVFIRGTVFNTDGYSIAGAKIELYKLDASGNAKRVTTSYSNYTGDFGFRQEDTSATYRVVASFKDATDTKDVVVDGAASYRVALKLDIQKVH